MSDERKSPQRPARGWGRWFGNVLVVLVLIALGWFGHGMMPGPPAGPPPGAGPMGPSGPPTVLVEPVSKARLDPPQEFVGRVEAIQAVDLLAHVQGYIETVHYEEGGLVKKGDLLVTIRQDDFEAQVAQSEAALAQARASLSAALADVQASKASQDAAKADQVRAEKFLKRLRSADSRSVVQADLDTAESKDLQAKALVQQAAAKLEQAKASVQQSKAAIQRADANLKLARINLDYTEIRSPIAGRIGRALYTPGDLVGPTSGPLARVVQIDPMRVVYSLTDRQYLTILEEDGTEDRRKWLIQLRLPNDKPYPAAGTWDFENNEMNSRTGNISLRARFDNPDRKLLPGSYVTVLLSTQNAPEVLTVPEEALLIGEGSTSVYVVDGENKVQSRPVQVGKTAAGRCEVTSGVSAGENVIVQGLQRVRPGLAVQAVANSAAPEGR